MAMKIFVTSDIHGNKTIMDKLKNIEKIADLILICGDIGGKNTISKTFQQFSDYQMQGAEYLESVLKELSIPSRFILGNDDWFEYDSKYHLTQDEEIKGQNFIPFEFVSITPFNTNREANENKLTYELNKLKADSNSIIVAHTPPYGLGDLLIGGNRCGSKAVREWIETVQPKMWLCGHIHENNYLGFIGDSLICNCACWYQNSILKGWLIDTVTMDYKEIEI